MEVQTAVNKGKMHVCLNQKSKVTSKPLDYEEKLLAAQETNAKLKVLWEIMRKNTVARKVEQSQISRSPQQDILGTLKKKQRKIMSQNQQLTNNLNCLINQNNKLKGQVDVSRSSRVIYSNVYKNLQKEIHKNEYQYKVILIDSLCYEQALIKVKQKLENSVKRIEKEIGDMEAGSMKKKSKTMKKKSRLDTGLSQIKESRTGTANKRSSFSEIKSNHALSSKRDQIEEGSSRKDVLEYKPVTVDPKDQLPPPEIKSILTNKSLKSRNKIPAAEDIDKYYDLEMKSNYYDNVLQQLRGICGGQTMEDINQCWLDVDKEIQDEYARYLSIEEDIKNIEDEMSGLGQKRGKGQTEGGSKSAEQIELQRVQQQMKKQKLRQQQFQAKLTSLMDLNCHRLSDEQLTNHITRIKRRAGSSPRELQKLLQNVGKQKNMTSGGLSSSRVSSV